ncbi:MAG: hypothetical protein LBJ48_03615, partial [Coriobacteriales bacterium]|nr:hypothetical protein [Coriobacteriales bacterium]
MHTNRAPHYLVAGTLRTILSCALIVILVMTLLVPFSLSSAYAAPTSAEKQAEADEASAALAVAEEEMI